MPRMSQSSIYFPGLPMTSCPEGDSCPNGLSLEVEGKKIISFPLTVPEEPNGKIPSFSLFFCESHIAGGDEEIGRSIPVEIPKSDLGGISPTESQLIGPVLKVSFLILMIETQDLIIWIVCGGQE